MIDQTIFIANQLALTSSGDELYKIGVCTALIKTVGTNYDVAGRVVHEDGSCIIFAGNPKRISVDGENLTEIYDVQRVENYISKIQSLKQKHKIVFNKSSFSVDGIMYYQLDDLDYLDA